MPDEAGVVEVEAALAVDDVLVAAAVAAADSVLETVSDFFDMVN